MGSTETTVVFSTERPESVACDALLLPVLYQKKWTPDALVKSLDKLLEGQLLATIEEEKFDGAAKKSLVFRTSHIKGLKAKRLVLIGLGEADKLTAQRLEGSVLKALQSVVSLEWLTSAAWVMPTLPAKTGPNEQAALLSVVDAIYQSTYQSKEAAEKKSAETKKDASSKKTAAKSLQKVTLLTTGKTATASQKQWLTEALAYAKARSLVKDLVNMPSNTKRTDTLVATAKTLGKLPGISVTVKSDVAWIEKNMPCFFEVARGSVATDPPKWITLTYTPQGSSASGKKSSKAPATKRLALVGKSVIFDTGGYQVKTGNYMNTMKGDMTGGASVLGAMQALAALQPKGVTVTAYLAATPNKIDSHAMLPDAIVSTTCGKKVEIRHTDAEGRLTLIDAVAKAVEDKPQSIVTIATLTGSASHAVGCRIALMGTDTVLRNKVEAAAKAVGDPVQSLEVDEADFEDIKSKLDGADIINTSHGKSRGAQTAAAFVFSGAPEGTAMAHLDIAGADMTPDEKATGIGVKTLIRFVLDHT